VILFDAQRREIVKPLQFVELMKATTVAETQRSDQRA
jgi:hypothetical protein